jgi:hypothetical protein
MSPMPEAAAQMNAPTPQEQILGIVNNHWQSRCVRVAAQLDSPKSGIQGEVLELKHQ